MENTKHSQTLIEKIEHKLSYPFRKGWPGVALAIIVIVFLMGATASAITDSAKPGDATFFIDRSFEKLRVLTSLSDTARFKHKVAIAKERLSELLEFNLDETEKLLGSLDELEIAIIDMKSEINNVGELSEAQKSANKVADNLLDLVARYRIFLLGGTDNTDGIQKELDDSVEEINKIVTVIQNNNPTSTVQTVAPANSPKAQEPAPSPSTIPSSNTKEDEDDNCDTTYQNLGGEVEREGVTLQQNECGEYTVSVGGTTYVLVTNNDLGYAIGKRVKYHGTTGTNNSIFLTEFDLDN